MMIDCSLLSAPTQNCETSWFLAESTIVNCQSINAWEKTVRLADLTRQATTAWFYKLLIVCVWLCSLGLCCATGAWVCRSMVDNCFFATPGSAPHLFCRQCLQTCLYILFFWISGSAYSSILVCELCIWRFFIPNSFAYRQHTVHTSLWTLHLAVFHSKFICILLFQICYTGNVLGHWSYNICSTTNWKICIQYTFFHTILHIFSRLSLILISKSHLHIRFWPCELFPNDFAYFGPLKTTKFAKQIGS